MANVISQMELRLRQRFEAYFMLKPEANIAIAAEVLIPSIKMKWLKVLLKLNPELTEQTVINTALETIQKFYSKHCIAFNFENPNANLSTMHDYFDFSSNDDVIDTTPSSQGSLIASQQPTFET